MKRFLNSGVTSKGGHMSIADAIGLMFVFGMFIRIGTAYVALLTYIDRNQKSNVLTFSKSTLLFVSVCSVTGLNRP